MTLPMSMWALQAAAAHARGVPSPVAQSTVSQARLGVMSQPRQDVVSMPSRGEVTVR